MRMLFVEPKVPTRGYASPYREQKIAAHTTVKGRGRIAQLRVKQTERSSRIGRALIALLLGACALSVPTIASAQGTGRVILDHPQRFAATVSDIGATLTEIVAAPSATQAIYVTQIVLASSTGTAGTFALRQGTGTNCATNPVGVFPQPGVATPSLTYVYPANTAVPLMIALAPPVRLIAGNALCLIGAATNLARGQVHGFIAP